MVNPTLTVTDQILEPLIYSINILLYWVESVEWVGQKVWVEDSSKRHGWQKLRG